MGPSNGKRLNVWWLQKCAKMRKNGVFGCEAVRDGKNSVDLGEGC